jgi:hypothetical protein
MVTALDDRYVFDLAVSWMMEKAFERAFIHFSERLRTALPAVLINGLLQKHPDPEDESSILAGKNPAIWKYRGQIIMISGRLIKKVVSALSNILPVIDLPPLTSKLLDEEEASAQLENQSKRIMAMCIERLAPGTDNGSQPRDEDIDSFTNMCPLTFDDVLDRLQCAVDDHVTFNIEEYLIESNNDPSIAETIRANVSKSGHIDAHPFRRAFALLSNASYMRVVEDAVIPTSKRGKPFVCMFSGRCFVPGERACAVMVIRRHGRRTESSSGRGESSTNGATSRDHVRRPGAYAVSFVCKEYAQLARWLYVLCKPEAVFAHMCDPHIKALVERATNDFSPARIPVMFDEMVNGLTDVCHAMLFGDGEGGHVARSFMTHFATSFVFVRASIQGLVSRTDIDSLYPLKNDSQGLGDIRSIIKTYVKRKTPTKNQKDSAASTTSAKAHTTTTTASAKGEKRKR